MEKNLENKYAVIMAGGVGSRFWPVSRQTFPKQFHDMLGLGQSLLQTTFDRLKQQVPEGNILILTNADYIPLVQEQLSQIPMENIVSEPAMRNTAPCILLAALKIQKKNPDAIMIVAPSDSYIENNTQFQKDLKTAFSFCEEHPQALMTLGIEPDSPNTGFGYIEYLQGDHDVKKVAQFREKPDLETAQSYIDAGNYLWNSGTFIWSVDSVLSAFAKAEPELFQLFEKGMPAYNEAEETEFLAENYEKAKNISIDYAVMERSKDVYTLPVDFGWNDVGTWSSLYSRLAKDENSNALVNASLTSREATGNMIKTRPGKKVIVQGLENYIIVDEDDVLMIMPLSADQDIKEIRNNAIKKYGSNLS
ncbi:mannose-1-phosphate guanylyltransferase [Nonlabens agnitus]|uniref:mannose-1-phosphate guanylyltransferase n=1 Tax=Nonlabens agnitus TaxID=870484 RepID=A0A2S9WRA0_9FLAO|nr:mannose-1-phosphate guanylyltransferase [Nonlabens agnitus]PRP66001.1 mannose-1-phosphate guanylyltransferase [Nonlabens agnitus]